jgi:hypothetical protein
MKRRRLAALSVLKRLKKHEMELENRQLGELRLQDAELSRQKQTLLDGIQQQAHSMNAELTPYMQIFLPAARQEVDALNEHISKLKPRISILEERIGEKFKEFKTIDIIHTTLQEKTAEEQEAREVAIAEEILLSRWSQKQ